jgi:glucoamylase
MGVKRPNDPTITNSLIAYDGVIKQTIGNNAYPAWFRYNFDGYGETNAGGPYNGSSGRGRLWPIFDAERGNYQIAATGTGSAGVPYLAALKAFSTPQGFISEQVWSPSTTCAVTRRRFPVGASPTRRFAPAGSNRSRHGGDEMSEAFG